MLDTTTHRIEGIATALSSISHGGEHAGTTGYLRRERMVQLDGSVVDVPIISGNAMRGVLRDHAATIMWEALGRPALPMPVFHLLWSGGSLAKAGASHVLSSRQLSDVRRLVPLVSLFGGSGAGRIMEGKLAIGKLVPVCVETAHVIPDGIAPASVSTVWTMVQIEEFSRTDDAKRDQLQPAMEGHSIAIGQGEQTEMLPIPSAPDDAPAQQMRYGVETIAAGTPLYWWMQLRQVTPVETALFSGALDSWASSGAHIGGRSATGHGRLRLDVHQWASHKPRITAGAALAIEGENPFSAHIESHRDEIMRALELFA